MSREHHKNLQRGVRAPLSTREQRKRSERHGKPHTMRRWTREEQEVPAGTPGAKHRVVEDPDTKEIVVKYFIVVDASRQVPVTEARDVRVAAGPTGLYGKVNAPPTVAKKVKAPK